MTRASSSSLAFIEALCRPINVDAIDDLGRLFESSDMHELLHQDINEIVLRKFVNILTGVPDKLLQITCSSGWFIPKQYWPSLLSKCSDLQPRVLLLFLRRAPRGYSLEYLSTLHQNDEQLLSLLNVMDQRMDSTLWNAAMNSLKRLEDDISRLVAILKQVRIDDAPKSIDGGLLHIAVLKPLILLHSDALLSHLIEGFVSLPISADPGRHIYNAVALAAVLGDTPSCCVQSRLPLLFEGVQSRLGSNDRTIHSVGAVIGELSSICCPTAEPNSNKASFLDLKTDGKDPVVKEIYLAFRYGDWCADAVAVSEGRPWAINDPSASPRPVLSKQKLPKPWAEVKPDEPVARNSKNRVRKFLYEALEAIKENHEKRAAAIVSLPDIIQSAPQTEISELSERLVTSILTCADPLVMDDFDDRILLVRMSASMRVPQLMAEESVRYLFSRDISMYDKAALLSAQVRSCQLAYRPVNLPESIHSSTRKFATIADPKAISGAFLDAFLLKAMRKPHYLLENDGWLGERLLYAAGTMIPSLVTTDFPRILNAIANILGIVEQKALCGGGLPVTLEKAMCVVCYAGIACWPTGCRKTDATGFYSYCAQLCERVACREGVPVELKATVGELAGVLKTSFTLEVVFNEMEIEDKQTDIILP